MTVKVELLDGKFITPHFDPEHSDTVLDFYIAKLIAGEILSYEVIA
jgi:Na+/citrate or Na+/malate symporter